MPNLYEDYAILDEQIKELTKQKDELKAHIIKELVDSSKEKLDSPVGKFTIYWLKTWSYTDKVKELEENYKAKKAEEESTGDATFVEKPSLRFTIIKL